MIGIPTPPAPPPTLRSMWSDSLRYWEPRRLIYNVLLIAVVGVQLVIVQGLGPLLSFHGLLLLVVMAAAANLCYTTAYLVDLSLQCSDWREQWLGQRGTLFFLGCTLAVALAVLSLPDLARVVA